MKSTIVIPFFNKWTLTHARLFEIYKHCPTSDVVLVNDCSTELSPKETEVAWWQNGPLKDRLKYYKNDKNLGFGQSMNVGVAIAIKNGADVIVLLSNDVVCSSDVGKEAIETIERYKEPVLAGVHLICQATDWNTLDGVGTVPYLNGWLLACHKDVWKQLGGFDPIYGIANCEDVDLSTTAWLVGVKLVLMTNVKVQHHGGQTVNEVIPDRYEQTTRNRDKWRLKWADKALELRIAIYGKD